MTPDKAFLQDVIEHPDDDAPRLVFADFLEEDGRADSLAWAELIRTQCRLARLGPDDPARPLVQARQDELLEQQLPTRAGRLFALGAAHVELRRGFVEMVVFAEGERPHAFDAEVLGRVARCFAVAPVRKLVLRHVFYFTDSDWGSLDWQRLAGMPELSRLTALELAGFCPSVKDFSLLLRSPHLAGLVALDLPTSRLNDACVKALVRAPGLPRLTSLGLAGDLSGDSYFGGFRIEPSITLVGLATLASSSLLARLDRLDLSVNSWLNDPLAEALAASPNTTRLRWLNLADCGISDTGALALARSPFLGGIEHLGLRGNPIREEGLRALRSRFGERLVVR
jgi:uncharacterized protein (TIGR02996 family)